MTWRRVGSIDTSTGSICSEVFDDRREGVRLPPTMRSEAHSSDWFVMLLVPSAEVVSVGYARANQSASVMNMLSVRPTDLWLALVLSYIS
jgi:hypothetical protein